MRSPSTGMVEDFFSALFYPGRLGAYSRGASLVEGLRMARTFAHDPVMVDEVVALFGPVPAGVVVDGTTGGGGHAAALLDAHAHLGVLALDRDPDAVEVAEHRLERFGRRVLVRRTTFDRMEEVVHACASDAGIWPRSPATAPVISGVLLDLGVSSPQLDRSERGFSYRVSGPLAMRMDASGGPSAADLVNTASVDELSALFLANGEGRLAYRIARAIVSERPVQTTGALAGIVARAVPAPARRRGHPARRVFQALRIAVNDELVQLARTLPAALGMLALGGRMVVISYHSGEDRLVKAAFAEAVAGGCTCPPGLPCVCGARPEHELVFRGARKPSAAEVARNHRAESARLRAVQRSVVA
ncbi:MAG TPA: 16S rRNA (cytosine(1402)-N(4))-methyltransferase RsmH [Acidimicrobiales bacterium]|nr:16S rRNA (cytosine(1402)-N(4))-methyltransferase RsmH [Acidimicrobiales bacterium]